MKKKHDFEEITRKGGQTTKLRHGREHFVKIGKLRAEAGIKRDPEYFKKLSAAGVEARKRKQAALRQKELDEKQPLDKLARVLTGK